MLSARSKDALTKLRRNLYLEAAFGVFTTLAFATLAINTTNLSSRFALIQLALLMTPFLFFYYLAHKNLQSGISLTKPLRQTLQDSVRFWTLGLRLYFWGGMLLLPVILIAAGYGLVNAALGFLPAFPPAGTGVLAGGYLAGAGRTAD